MVTVSERKFKIGRLEKWWVAFGSPQFYPDGCKHIAGSWFWRER